MAKFILTEKQMAEVLNHIEKGKKTKKFNEKQLNENGSDKKKYSLEDLESAFNAGRIISQHSDSRCSDEDFKYWNFQDWFENLNRKNEIFESKDGSYMSKQQLFTIATLAYKMWEQLGDDEQLEDWMESKIAQAEQSVVAVVKAYMYDEVEDKMKGMDKLDHNDLVIGN